MRLDKAVEVQERRELNRRIAEWEAITRAGIDLRLEDVDEFIEDRVRRRFKYTLEKLRHVAARHGLPLR